MFELLDRLMQLLGIYNLISFGPEDFRMVGRLEITVLLPEIFAQLFSGTNPDDFPFRFG